MQRNIYSAPTLEELIVRANGIRAEYYKSRKPGSNPKREALIKELEVVHQRIQQMNTEKLDDKARQQLHDVSLGAWLYLAEILKAEYTSHNPTAQTTMFVRTGSELYNLVQKKLNLKNDAEISDVERFIYLDALDQFAKEQNSNLAFEIGEDTDFQARRVEAIKADFVRMKKFMKKLMAAVPTREALLKKFATMYPDYINATNARWKKTDENRPLCAQLTQVIGAILSESKPTELKDAEREYKIMIGMLIYIMRDIANNASMVGNYSKLYYQAKDILNGTPDTLSKEVQIDCLAALEVFLKDNNNIAAIDLKAQKLFGIENCLREPDGKLRSICSKLSKEIDSLSSSRTSHIGTTVGSAVAGATMFPVGSGVGHVLGGVASNLPCHFNEVARSQLRNFLDNYARYALGLGGSRVSLIATAPLISAVYEAAAGNFFGAVFALGGGFVGGVAGHLFFDIAMMQLVQYLYQGSEYRDPAFVRQDERFIQAIKHQAPMLMTDAERQQLDKVIGRWEEKAELKLVDDYVTTPGTMMR